MPFSNLSLEKIAHCQSLKDLIPGGQQELFNQGMQILHQGHLKGHKIEKDAKGALRLEFYFHPQEVSPEIVVYVHEKKPQGSLDFESESAVHSWSVLILMWWAYAQDASFLRRLNPQIAYFCRDFQEIIFQKKNLNVAESVTSVSAHVKLESLSLCLDDLQLRGTSGLGDLLPPASKNYDLKEVPYVEDPRNSSLWDMPQVFRKPINIDTVFYWSDLKKQNQLAALVRYNFSDGMQLSSREILRHSYKELVPRDLLPCSLRKSNLSPGWPLVQRTEESFVSRDMSEIEEVMQELLFKVCQRANTGDIELYLQSETQPDRALRLSQITFEAENEFQWDVRFEGDQTVITNVILNSLDINAKYFFFQSFALNLTEKKIVVFPWGREAEQLRSFFMKHVSNRAIEGLMPFSVEGTDETGALLKFLRSRSLPVKIRGGSQFLSARSSKTEIYFKNTGGFQIEHLFENGPDEVIRHQGWTLPTVLILKALSQGISVLTKSDIKTIISRTGKKRDWDYKLLKHLGILQYVTFEALSLFFDEKLSDGMVCDRGNLISVLQEKIQFLLVSSEGNLLDRGTPLHELCSRPAISCLESYVEQIFKMVTEPYSVFSHSGELVYAGVVERDFRLLHQILKHWSLATQGVCFKKARTSLLGKIWDGDLEANILLRGDDFYFPTNGKDALVVSQALLLLQPLVHFGFKLLLNGQPLIELNENEFQVDFEIVSQLDNKDINWFELNPHFFLQGEEVDPDSLKNFGSGGVLEYNGKFYIIPSAQIPSMRRLENFWLKLQLGKKDKSKKTWNDRIFQIPKNQTLELLALRASGYKVRGDAEWTKLCDFYDSLSTKKNLMKIPASVHGLLKPYQHEGTHWLHDLYKLKLGALLADDMGLGKTLQALTFLEYLRTQNELGQVLIIVPSSLVYNWESEIQKFTPELPLVIFTSKDMDKIGKRLESHESLVVVTTYGLLMENEKFLSQYKWNILIFDEAQNLKNITTKRTSSARMLPAKFRICMTGTPMENHYGEFFSLMDLIVPGCLGKYDDFRRHYVNTDVVQVTDIEDLKLKAKPLLLRRTKKEILDQLPEKQETKVSIAFEEKQKKIYRDIALAYNEKIQQTMQDSSEGQVQLQMLTALLRLRQACSDPAALPQVQYDKVPPKIEALLDSMQEIIDSGESALVFTQFIQTLEHTEKVLREAGIPVYILHGAIPTKQRQKILREFNEYNGGAVLLMTLKTGGVGLNLTKASYVFHLEPWWNPSVENQATDRAHRIGQKKSVHVFRYIMHESLEEKIEELKVRKSKKFTSLFTDAENVKDLGQGSSMLSKEDFDFLLGIK